MPEPIPPIAPYPARLLVVCLCADWCGVCRDYRERFALVAQRFPDAQFIWVDIEDEAELVDALDVTDFPTLLIGRGGKAVFCGPLTPQPETLERLVRNHQDAPAQVLDDPALHALVQQLSARAP